MKKRVYGGFGKNNAIPIILSLSTDVKNLDRYFDMVDGILFTGGHDINPKFYNQEKKKPVDYNALKEMKWNHIYLKKLFKMINQF